MKKLGIYLAIGIISFALLLSIFFPRHDDITGKVIMEFKQEIYPDEVVYLHEGRENTIVFKKSVKSEYQSINKLFSEQDKDYITKIYCLDRIMNKWELGVPRVIDLFIGRKNQVCDIRTSSNYELILSKEKFN